MILLQLRHPQRLPYISHCYSCNNSLYCWRFFLRVWERISGGERARKFEASPPHFHHGFAALCRTFPVPRTIPPDTKAVLTTVRSRTTLSPATIFHLTRLWQDNYVQTIPRSWERFNCYAYERALMRCLYFICERKYALTHVKVTWHWKSTLSCPR